MEEIRGNHGFDVAGNVLGSIGPKSNAGVGEGEYTLTIVGDETRIVGGFSQHLVTGDITVAGNSNMSIQTTGNYAVKTTSGITSIQSGSSLHIESNTTSKIKSGTFTEIETGSSFDLLSGTIVQIRSGGGTPTSALNIELNPIVDMLNLG